MNDIGLIENLPPYLTLKQFRDKVFPVSERQAWRLISTGDFPKPAARIGNRTAVWRTSELLAWIQDQERRELNHQTKNISA